MQLCIIYVPSQQLQGEQQTQHSADTGSDVKGKQGVRKRDKLQACTGKGKHINTEEWIIIIILIAVLGFYTLPNKHPVANVKNQMIQFSGIEPFLVLVPKM